VGEQPVLPSYGGACISNVVSSVLAPGDETPSWLPASAAEAEQVVLLVIDGLGWEQLAARRALVPTLAAMDGGPITTVAPSTTATALTSISTGLTPGEHGIMGYRMAVHGEVLNVLRWTTATGDARNSLPPQKLQLAAPFLGHRPPVITRAEFEGSGFTQAHLDGVRFVGYRTLGTLVQEVSRLTRGGEPFVYAYYEGLDKVSHEYGLGDHYDSELAWIDRLVSELLGVLPPGAVLLVTADHGQVEVGERVIDIHPDVLAQVSMQSGEGRMRWFHARAGRAGALLEAVTGHHGDHGWVRTREETIAEGWFGPHVSEVAGMRLGDVLIAARDDVAFHDPNDTGPYRLIGRHGSLTSAEMLVPLLASAG
jgi:predicted AlkP superfamily pyrophosphatase or phosphodiesterase